MRAAKRCSARARSSGYTAWGSRRARTAATGKIGGQRWPAAHGRHV